MKLKTCVLVSLLLIFVSIAFAQFDLEKTFTSSDESFEFMYPSNWFVSDAAYDDSGFVLLLGSMGDSTVTMSFAGSVTIDSWTDGARNMEDVVDVLSYIYSFNNATEIEIDGREALQTSYSLSGLSGTSILIEMADGSFGMVLVIMSDEEFEAVESEIYQIISTFNSLDTDTTSSDSEEGTVEQLNDYNADDWRDTIAELESHGLIASGGALIFNEPQAYFEGIGSWFTPLSRYSDVRDIVVAAELDFTSDSRSLESCSLLARIQRASGSNSISTYLEIGMDNEERVYWIDRAGEDMDSGVSPVSVDLDESHHFLFLALDDQLTVYLDGQLIFDEATIPSRSGFFGIALLGYGDDSRCEGHNIWAYNAPIFVEGLCEATSSNNVNKRSGPGTNFARAGTLSSGARIAVEQQASDGSYTWYQLEDESWVREDVVNLVGDCSDIPEN